MYSCIYKYTLPVSAAPSSRRDATPQTPARLPAADRRRIAFCSPARFLPSSPPPSNWKNEIYIFLIFHFPVHYNMPFLFSRSYIFALRRLTSTHTLHSYIPTIQLLQQSYLRTNRACTHDDTHIKVILLYKFAGKGSKLHMEIQKKYTRTA